jgi:hypothetical protein
LATEEEQAVQPEVASVRESFPGVEEHDLHGLVPWPSGEEQIFGFYADLYGPAPPPTADPFVNRLAELRLVLAHIAALKYSGADSPAAISCRPALDASVAKYIGLHREYAATVIQRWWKAGKPSATGEDRARLRRALRGGPGVASSSEEEEIRKELIRGLLTVAAAG